MTMPVGVQWSTLKWATCVALGMISAPAPGADVLAALRARPPEDEIIYLIMPDRFDNADPGNDRGGMQGPRRVTGYDPTDKAWYHGGDLRGVTRRLDYIQSLGATALWLTPVFRNKPVQTNVAGESAGYHGYWGLDFTHIDPHLGTDADYKALVDAAHARGMKVYFDIVVNHTADVIRYRECPGGDCPYRSVGEFPRQAYTAYVPPGEEHVKSPEWLNDPRYYHNRGDSVFRGESSRLGDFFGLDDVYTEQSRVVDGMIDLYGAWIDNYGIDGFRIDTARHVNPEFWRAFVPAMLERARLRAIPNFHIFGELMEFEPGTLARYTRVDKLPAVNDFALQRALVDAIARDGAPEIIANIFLDDVLYQGGETQARQLVTLTGNHDVLRFAHEVRRTRPAATSDEVLRRVRLAYAVVLLSRGVPALYYGDEQGMTGAGPIDQDSREDLFATQVASYRDEEHLGRPAGARPDFDTSHPLYKAIAELARLRSGEVALRRGRQVIRHAASAPGLLAFSRLGEDGTEILIAFNTSNTAVQGRTAIEANSVHWLALHGECAGAPVETGSYMLEVAPLDYIVCKATR
jgi:neopullulanase